MSFLTPVDIANRGLQHCGVDMMDPTLGFTEQSDRAAQTAFVYDKLRRSELRRNNWQFAIKRSVIRPIVFPDSTDQNGNPLQPTLMLNPQLWSSTQTYFVGSVVEDASGSFWMSLVPDNLGNAPGLSTYWDAYYGPSAATPYDTTGQTAYYAGDVVFISTGNGVFTTYMSRINSNSVVPNAIDAWVSTSIYMRDSIVQVGGINYQSLFDVNINNNPAGTAYSPWVSTTTYAIGNPVFGNDGFLYTSLTNGNVGNNPPTDGGVHWNNTGILAAWSTVLTRSATADEWLQLTVSLVEIPTVTPLGIAMNINGPQRSVYPLPSNFLRLAPQDPKQGSVSYLGAPSGNQYLDWILDGPFLITRNTAPIVLRFVADITNVRDMDDMFCEGLGCRIGYEVAPKLTQSIAKRNDIAQAYKTFMGEARLVNGIEEGPTEPPEDDYITCRL
jgi:hypothetical protein